MIINRIKNFISSTRPNGQILLYHRVAPTLSDPQLLAVSPKCFEEQISFISKNAVPMALIDMVRAAFEGSLPKRAVAITFDDGYADNYYYAKPILEKYGVPATVFAVSSSISSQSEYWWDTIDRAILGQKGRVSLQLDIAGEIRDWTLSGDPFVFPSWTVLDNFDPTPRHTVYREIMSLVKPLSPEKQFSVVNTLQEQACIPACSPDNQRPMTVNELRGLVEGGLIDVGAHTVSHPQLSALSREQQFKQILDCRRALETLIDRDVIAFAYPYGTRADYTPYSVDAVRESGFTLACSNFPGMLVKRRLDAFQLPRYLVRQIPLSTFQSAFEARINGAQ